MTERLSPEDKKQWRVMLYLDKEEFEQATHYSKELKISKAQLFRMLLRKYVYKQTELKKRKSESQ